MPNIDPKQTEETAGDQTEFFPKIQLTSAKINIKWFYVARLNIITFY